MSPRVNRREFVKTGAAAAVAGGVAPRRLRPGASRHRRRAPSSRSWSRRPTATGSRTAVRSPASRRRSRMIAAGGRRARRAHRGRQHRRARSRRTSSVGYGGLPNADGVVQLDSCCMHGPKKRAGGVGGARGRAHAVARGEGRHGPDRPSPARRRGRADLRAQPRLRDRGRPQHASGRAKPGSSGSGGSIRSTTSIPIKRMAAGLEVTLQMVARGADRSGPLYGTINCDGISPKGEICGVTTTSGLAWKIPGRLGDSPILGAGLYVDGERRRGGLDRARRSEPLRPLFLPDRREHAPGDAPEGRRHGRAQAHQGEHDREAAAERRTATRTSASTSTS